MNESYLLIYFTAFFLTGICHFLFTGFRYREFAIYLPVLIMAIAFRRGGPWIELAGVALLYLVFLRLSLKKLPRKISLLLELSIFYLAYLADFRISFIQFGGRFIYLNFLSPILTIIWLFLLVRIFKFLSHLPGMVPGILIIYPAILFIISSTQSTPLFFAKSLSLVLSGIATWHFILFILKKPRVDSLQISFIGFLAGIMTITGVTKRVAFVTMIFPSFFVILPIFFIISFIFYFYLRENINEIKKSSSYRIIWRFTHRRAIISTYFIFLYLAIVCFTLLGHASISVKVLLMLVSTISVLTLIFILTIKMEEREKHVKIRKPTLLGVAMDNLTREELLSEIELALCRDEKIFITTPNAIAFVIAEHNAEFREALSSASYNIPDGAGVIWASDVLDCSLGQRITGVDFMLSLLKKAESEEKSVYFLGSTDEVISELKKKVSASHPGLKICGSHNGYLNSDDESKVIHEINSLKPDFLFVAMGMPKQELWIHRNLPQLETRLAIGVGGAFNVHSGVVNRAPKFLRICGLEWLWRFIREPWRLVLLWQLFFFVLMVLSAKIEEE